ALAGSVAFALAIKFSGGSAHRVVTIVTLLGLLAVSAGLAYTFSSSQRLAPLDSSILLRYNGYFGASKMIAERPFLGSGPSSYVIETPRFWTPYEQEWFETRSMMNEHVHNDVLESAVELGLGGALLYLAIFAIAITASMALAQKRESPCDRRLGLFFGCFFVAYGIDGLFGFNIRMPVSGCLFFVTAGALEGQFLERLALAKSNRWAFSRLVRPVAAVCVALALAYLGTRVHLSEIRFFEGKGFVNAKRYAEADGKFASAEARAPWNWRPARERGLAAYYEGDYERAIEHLERSADRNPYWIMTLVPLANINLKWATELFPDDSAERIDALADARKFANDAWELSRGTATAAEVAARATYGLAKEGEASGVDWTEAKEILERSLALEQENAPTLRAMLADANKQLGQEAEALAQFLLAASGQPEVDSHWERLYGQSGAMETYSAMRDELDSAIALGREVSLTPSATMASLLQWRARVLEVAYGDSSAAARDYEDARHLAPRDAALWGRYAGFASRNDRMAEFRKAVLNAHGVTGHAGPIPAIEALAAAWNLDEADTARAAQLLATAVEAPVVNGETLSGAAQFGWAVDLLLLEIQAASPAPHDAGPILYCLGRVYRAIQNYGQAAAMFGAAAGLLDGPEKLQCQRYWAEALVQTGKGHDAILMLRQALKTEPSQHALRRFLARILKRSGRIPEARAEYERLLRTTTLSVEDRAQLQRELSLLPN
ncbi:MAG: tetratricopeptide repeat protein, partial [Candidatus Hydrogenedentes bacterium]|nr:tetratricopeptide repeat protein [Candidatus Hydrogenedentota bacterium]